MRAARWGTGSSSRPRSYVRANIAGVYRVSFERRILEEYIVEFRGTNRPIASIDRDKLRIFINIIIANSGYYISIGAILFLF